MNRRRWPRLLPFLALATVAAALAWHVESQLQSTGRPAEATVPPALEQAALARNASTPVMPGLSLDGTRRALGQVTARNLFATDRRPPANAPDETAGQQAQEPMPAAMLDATLSGIVLAGERSTVVLTDDEDGTTHRLQKGDSHRGWTLVRVSAGNALFRRDGRDTRLDLRFGMGEGESAVNQSRSSARVRQRRRIPFPNFGNVNVESMQGTAGSTPRPAQGGPRSSLRRGWR